MQSERVDTAVPPNNLIVVLVFVLLLTAVPPTLAKNESEAPTESGYYHLISCGKTLSKIAFAYGVPIQAVLDANPQVTDPDVIYYGTVIFIPHSINPPYSYPPYGCRIDHVVQSGETVFSIGREYDQELRTCNELTRINTNYG